MPKERKECGCKVRKVLVNSGVHVRHVARNMNGFGKCTQLHLEPCKCMESE